MNGGKNAANAASHRNQPRADIMASPGWSGSVPLRLNSIIGAVHSEPRLEMQPRRQGEALCQNQPTSQTTR